MRDIRIVNMSQGQRADSDKVFKRIGEISYRNLGALAKIGLLDEGKALITKGFRVSPSSGMTVQVSAGNMLQRISSGDLMPVIMQSAQTVTLDAASGVSRIDIIEAQVKSIVDKDDISQAVLDPVTGAISLESIKRDIKYYVAIQKKTNNSAATAATAGVLTGTIAIPSTINLSSNYLLHLADGEDGSFQEIDLRGATPEATTAAEIIAGINAAVGRTMASLGGGNVIVLTGVGTGITSYFNIQPPVTNSDADALETVFGVSSAGAYNYIYQGVNEWIKLAEIDVGAATVTITSGLIRNIDNKSTWASDSDEIIVKGPLYNPGTELSIAEDMKTMSVFRDVSPEFPWFCLSKPSENLTTANYPLEFINKRRARKYIYDEFGTNTSAFSGSWSGNVFTLDDNAANNAMLAELAEDWLYHGSPTSNWRIINDGTLDFKMTTMDVTARTITVDLDSETATGTSIEIYTNRVYRNATQARHFSEAGLATYQAGGGKSGRLFRRDQMQGHWHSAIIRAYTGADNLQISGYATLKNDTGPVYTRDPANDGTNGTPRTGAETIAKSSSDYRYIYVGSYTA